MSKGKYLFISYGLPGWRGVQMRAIKVANEFDKKNVIFWNAYDSNFIKKAGFAVKTINQGFKDPEKIYLPKDLKAVVFADFPTNELSNFAIYLAAKNKKVPVFVLDNIYRRHQLTEGVYKYFYENSTKLLLNGPSLFQKYAKKAKIVAPFITYRKSGNEKDHLLDKFEIDKKNLIIFGVGYNNIILKKIELLHKKISKELPVTTLIAGVENLKESKRVQDIIYLPFLYQDEFHQYMSGSDIVVTKFGYLQILEALSLAKPVICLGEGGYLLRTPNLIDKALQDVIVFDPELKSNSTVNYIRKFYRNYKFREKQTEKIRNLEGGRINGATEIKRIIEKDLSRKKKIKNRKDKKILILGLNSEFGNVEKDMAKIKGEKCIIHFIMPDKSDSIMKKRPDEEILNSKIETLFSEQENEMLPHSFKKVYLFSRRRYDGLVDIGSWYYDIVSEIKLLVSKSDMVYIYSNIYPYIKELLPKSKKYRFIK